MKDYDKIYTNITQMSEQYRSKIIERTIIIEAFISEILTDITSNSKTKKSIEKHLFSDATTLETKINLFNSMNKAGAFNIKTPNPDLNNDLKYLQKLRNFLSHSLLDTSKEFMDIYDYSFIRYQSFTTKGVLNIDIYYENQKENVEKRIYNSMEIVKRVNRTEKTLGEIQENLKNKS